MSVTKKATDIVLVRHCEGEHQVGNKNNSGFIYESFTETNAPLTYKGLEQAREVGKNLKEHFGDKLQRCVVFSSTQKRALETANAATQVFLGSEAANVILDARLCEVNHGIKGNIGIKAYNDMFEGADLLSAFKKDSFHTGFIGGNSRADVECKLRSFLSDLNTAQREDRFGSDPIFFLFTHGRAMDIFNSIFTNTITNASAQNLSSNGAIMHYRLYGLPWPSSYHLIL